MTLQWVCYGNLLMTVWPVYAICVGICMLLCHLFAQCSSTAKYKIVFLCVRKRTCRWRTGITPLFNENKKLRGLDVQSKFISWEKKTVTQNIRWPDNFACEWCDTKIVRTDSVHVFQWKRTMNITWLGLVTLLHTFLFPICTHKLPSLIRCSDCILFN